jgi:hypothetical protein
MLHRLSWLAVLVVLLFDTLCGSVAARSATLGPLVTVSPQQGRPGTTVRVTPTLTTPSECTAAWDSDPPVTFSCGPEPKADNLLQWTTLTVPEGAFPGPHTITVCSPGCGGVEPAWEQSAPFTVLAVVPDLVKPALGIDSAREVLKEAGLTLGAINGRSGDPAARITAQDPGPGTLVDPNSAVNVTVEVPQTTVTVPNLQGLTQARADALVRRDGLALQVTSGSGRVESQDPPPGSSVPTGTTVNVVLRAGQPVVFVTVPDLRGKSLDEARANAEGAGLVVQVSGSAQNGFVDRQNPAPRTRVQRGSTVTVSLQVLVPRSSRRVPSSVWGVVAVAALAAAAVATWLIRRLRMRSAKWARDHIRVTADADAGQISLAQTSPTPTRTFWLEPHANAGLQTLEELRR